MATISWRLRSFIVTTTVPDLTASSRLLNISAYPEFDFKKNKEHTISSLVPLTSFVFLKFHIYIFLNFFRGFSHFFPLV